VEVIGFLKVATSVILDMVLFNSALGIPNTQKLELLSLATQSSPMMLKQRVGTARTYIRPLQKDLNRCG
jgi:hypothetical protein